MDDWENSESVLARWMTRCRWWLLAAAGVLAVISWLGSGSVTYDRSMESMFANDDPELARYRQLKRTFGGNEVVLVVYTEPELWDDTPGWLERMENARRRVERVPGVESVLSIERLLDATPGPRRRTAARIRQLFSGLTHGPDGEMVALVCLLDPSLDRGAGRQQTIGQLAQIARSLPEGTITGEPVMISEGFRLVEQDADRLTIYSGLLLGVTIWFCFRSLRWVIIPALVVGLSVSMTHAVLALLKLELTMVSSMLMAVVMVIAVATLIHIAVRYEQAVADGLPARQAVYVTISQLGMAVVWTCLTDAAGFGALMSASIGPVHDFGLMLAVGSLAVLLSTALIVPALATVHRPGRRSPVSNSEWLGRRMERLPPWLLRHRLLVLGSGLLVAGVVGWGSAYLQIESDFTRNFQSDSPLVRAYARVERELGGAGVCDIVIPAPEDLNWGYLQRVLRMEQHLRQELGSSAQHASQRGLTKVISLADAVVVMSPVNLQRVPRLLRAPALDSGLKLMQREIPDFYAALYGKDPETGGHYLRVMLRTWERQPAESKTALIHRTQEIAREHFPEAKVTGYFVLLTELIRSLLSDQWITFGVAMVAILIMMWLAFRRLGWSIAALIPNVLPIFIVLGAVGWMSLAQNGAWRVNMGVAMIAAVSTGISIDGSVHYLYSYRAGRQKGASHLEALGQAHRQVGRALGLATLALVVGFLVLCTSRFMPTVYFGALASLTMAGGTVGNLIFLPLLLRPKDSG